MKFEEDDNRARAGRQMCKMTETPAYGCNPFEFGREQPTAFIGFLSVLCFSIIFFILFDAAY